MHEFVYHVPTKVVFGCGACNQVGDVVREYGFKRCLVVTGQGSAIKSGLIDRITAQLAEKGVEYAVFSGAQPNPLLSHARAGVAKALELKADLILAVGGGSTIDTAKAIAHGTANPETDLWQFWLGKATLTKTTAVGAVLTIPAAGSETSDSAVLTDGDAGVKRGLNTDFNRPVFAVLDPELTLTLPPYQVACGVTDILMHTLDRYFNPYVDNDTTDAIAEALLRVVLAEGDVVREHPGDLHAMSELMWAGSLSHNNLTGLGGKKDFAVHQLGHALSAKYNVTHGASLSAVWKSWASYVAPVDGYARFARFARNVWGVTEEDDKAAALKGIALQSDYFHKLGMPVNLQELGVGEVDDAACQALAELCSYGRSRTIGTFRVLNADDILAIYRSASSREN